MSEVFSIEAYRTKGSLQRHRTSTLKDLRIKLMAFMPEGG